MSAVGHCFLPLWNIAALNNCKQKCIVLSLALESSGQEGCLCSDFINLHNNFCLARGYVNNVELEAAPVIKVSFSQDGSCWCGQISPTLCNSCAGLYKHAK